MPPAIQRFLQALLHTIYSPRCIACDLPIDGPGLCKACANAVHFLCHDVTARIDEHYDSLFAVAAYEGPLLSIVHKFKYGRGRVAHRTVEGLLADHLKVFGDIDCIVPVPLKTGRYIMRGYNQAVVVARFISRNIKKPIFYRALTKKTKTPPQVGLPLDERRKNLKGAFAVPRIRPQPVKDKNVLLVDDVVTTGATVNECARILKRAGAGRVDVLALAKTL